MARFNEILVGRYNRFLQKLFSMKGGAVIPQLASEILPVFPFFSGAENRYLEGWDRYGQAVAPPASAGNQTGVRLRNPAGSNVIAVIEKLDVAFTLNDTAFSISRGTATADLATLPSGTLRMDPRGRSNPSCVYSDQNNAVGLPALSGSTAFVGGFILANTIYSVIATDTQEIPLLPGDALQVAAGAVNEGVYTAIWWRERALEDSERT